MSDEQTIYIGPQDDLTNVRERLERIPTRRVTLVIPSQTLLRSLIAWRNLYARAQELGKEVFIISSDPQIRSVAQAAKFKVAALDSGSPSKLRPSGRILRPPMGGRGQSAPSAEPRVPPMGGRGAQRTSGSAPSRQSDQSPFREPPPAQPGPPEGRMVPTNGFTTDELSGTDISPPDSGARPHEQPYDFHFDTSPPIRPLSREQIEEEPDLFLDDVQMSHNIFKAASEGKKEDVSADSPLISEAVPEQPPSAQEPSQPYTMTPISDEADPFVNMGDHEPPLPGEQRGSVSIDGFDTTEQRIQDVSDFTTEKIQGGYGEEVHEGNLGPIIVDADPPGRTWMDMLAESEQGAEGVPSSPRPHGIRPRNSLTGNIPLQQRDDERLRETPPVEDQPTQITPQGRPAEPAPMPMRARASSPDPAPTGPISSSKNRGSPSGPTMSGQPAPSRSQSRQETQRSGAAMRSGARGAARGTGKQAGSKDTASQRRSVNSVIALVTIIIALLLLLGALAYVVPSATVTVILATKDYTSPVTLIAKPQQPVAPGFVPAEKLTQDFSATVTAKATGNVAVPGSSTATGNVTFTNNSKVGLDIPTGTIVVTANGTQFTTNEDVFVVAPGGNVPNTIPITVQGTVNADAGTVTVIPPDSLSAIAKHNGVTVADVRLQISNPSPITGAGTKQAPAVQQADIEAAKALARTQERSAIDAWTKQNSHAGDVAGHAIITNIAVVHAPALNTEEDSGTFPATLKLSVVMLMVRNADLQAATATTLNDRLKKDKVYKGSYVVVSDHKQPLTIAPLTVKGDDKTLSLSFTPKAKIVPNISKEQVQRLLVGKLKSEAQSALMTLNPAKTKYVQTASVETWPSFITWIPFLTSRIDVHLLAGTSLMNVDNRMR